jgi:Ricin-type beta-trefoil lectin domain
LNFYNSKGFYPEKEIKFSLLDNINPFKFFSVNVEARNLNNSKSRLLLYNWNNGNNAMDLPGGNLSNGQQFQTWSRHGSENQLFEFDNGSNQIKIRGKCLDLSAGSESNGNKIQIWDCQNGNQNQRFFFDGLYLKLWKNPNKCIDSNGGSSIGAKIQIWDCNGTSGQRWVAGKNNFGTPFGVRIRASGTGYYNNQLQSGHVLLSFSSNGALINTISSWPGYDNQCNNEGDWRDAKENNICDNDAAFVDKDEDRRIVFESNKPGTPESTTFRTRFVSIDKRISDLYRYNSGYRWGRWDYGRSNINYLAWFSDNNNGNCASFSSMLWNDIMIDIGQYSQNKVTSSDVPGVVAWSLPQ